MQQISLQEFFGFTKSVQLIFENDNISTYLIEVDESAKSILEFTINESECYVEIKNNIVESADCNEDCKRKKKREIAKESYKTIKEFIDNHGELSHMSVGMASPEEDTHISSIHILHKLIQRRPIGECNCSFANGELQLELNTTATAGGEYKTPHAFSRKEKKKGKPKKWSYVEPSLMKSQVNEDNINEILESYTNMYNKIMGR